jgi:hypothetical protein
MDAGPVRTDTGKRKEKIILIILFIFLRPCRRTYTLMCFLGGWKCEWEVDVGCGQKRFLDQISNPHI